MANATNEITALRDIERRKTSIEERAVRAQEQAADALESINLKLNQIAHTLGSMLRNQPPR